MTIRKYIITSLRKSTLDSRMERVTKLKCVLRKKEATVVLSNNSSHLGVTVIDVY